MDAIPRWTGRLAAALQTALRVTNEQFAADIPVATRTVATWHERPESVLSEPNQQALDTIYQRADDQVRARFAALARDTDVNESVAIVPADYLAGDVTGALMAAADESSTDTLLRSSRLGPDVLPRLAEEATQIARFYDGLPPQIVFQRARRIRDITIELMNSTRRPGELTDLYVTAGQVVAIMASIAWDLGHTDAADPLVRSAITYAEMGGHRSLQAWSLGLAATLDFWRGNGVRAIHQVEEGLALGPTGASHVRLLNIAARAHAVRGDSDAIRLVLAEARLQRDIADTKRDTLHDDIAGEFRFDDARADACAGAAWLAVGNGAEAVRYTKRTLDAHANSDSAVPLGMLCGARIDTAAALLLQGEFDEASSHLESVLATDPTRSAAINGRLQTACRVLQNGRWKDDAAAAHLAGQVIAWVGDNAQRRAGEPD